MEPKYNIIKGPHCTCFSWFSCSQKHTSKVLLSDAGFQLQSLEFMLGNGTEEEAAGGQPPAEEKTFDFRNCESYLIAKAKKKFIS